MVQKPLFSFHRPLSFRSFSFKTKKNRKRMYGRGYKYWVSFYIELSNSFLIGRKRTLNSRNQRPWSHNCILYNYHVKDTQGHGLSCQVRALCVAFRQRRSKSTTSIVVFIQCIIKQLLGSIFVLSRIIKVSVRVISLCLRLRLIIVISTLIILDITKTPTNDYLLMN